MLLQNYPSLGSVRRPDAAIGSIWSLTTRVSIIVPRGQHAATIALLAETAPDDRYTLAAGTKLRLLENNHDDQDPLANDLVTYIQHFEGSSRWRLKVEDGPSRGIVIDVPTDFGPAGRYPAAAQAASLALQLDEVQHGGRATTESA